MAGTDRISDRVHAAEVRWSQRAGYKVAKLIGGQADLRGVLMLQTPTHGITPASREALLLGLVATPAISNLPSDRTGDGRGEPWPSRQAHTPIPPRSFLSPSGNLVCGVGPGNDGKSSATCEIRDFT
jgi:hypothetical protein